MKRGRRGNAIADAMPWIIISLLILVLSLVAIAIWKGTGFSLIDKFKSLLGGFGG